MYQKKRFFPPNNADFDTKSALLLFARKRPAYGRSTLCSVWTMLVYSGRKQHLAVKMGPMVKRRGFLAFNHWLLAFDYIPLRLDIATLRLDIEFCV